MEYKPFNLHVYQSISFSAGAEVDVRIKANYKDVLQFDNKYINR